MRFGTTVTAVLASLTIISASAAVAYAGTPSVPTGDDVSYP
jgi:hypothetical protein